MENKFLKGENQHSTWRQLKEIGAIFYWKTINYFQQEWMIKFPLLANESWVLWNVQLRFLADDLDKSEKIIQIALRYKLGSH